jgi:hypothetical protein
MENLETEAYFDKETDCLLVKVRIWEQGSPYPTKRGMIFKFTSEQIKNFPYVAEGSLYPKQHGNTQEFLGTEATEDVVGTLAKHRTLKSWLSGVC